MKLNIKEQRGTCRWCGCAYFNPCPDDCAWVNRTQTLCSSCAKLDKLIRSKRGRRALAAIVHEYTEGMKFWRGLGIEGKPTGDDLRRLKREWSGEA